MNNHDEAWARQIATHGALQRLELTPSHVLFKAAELMRQEADALERIAKKKQSKTCECVDTGFVKNHGSSTLVEVAFSYCPKCGARL